MLTVLKVLLLPPFGLLLLAAAGLLMLPRRPRLGRALAVGGLLLLGLLSTPVVGRGLLRSLERLPPLPPEPPLPAAGAIVVLGANLYEAAPELGGDAAGALTLERLHYAARLHRLTGAPILTSGGALEHGSSRPLGEVMKNTLVRDFRVPVRWVEARSRNTLENARSSAAILRRENIHSAYVVTHSWHMPRSLRAFARTGLPVVAAPTRFTTGGTEWRSFIPSHSGLSQSYYACHEWLGRGWYATLDLVAPRSTTASAPPPAPRSPPR